jgi:hypothetical protein
LAIRHSKEIIRVFFTKPMADAFPFR